jgi:hypothetical protein
LRGILPVEVRQLEAVAEKTIVLARELRELEEKGWHLVVAEMPP